MMDDSHTAVFKTVVVTMIIHSTFKALGFVAALVPVMSILLTGKAFQRVWNIRVPLTFDEPTLISGGITLPWKYKIIVSVVILFPLILMSLSDSLIKKVSMMSSYMKE